MKPMQPEESCRILSYNTNGNFTSYRQKEGKNSVCNKALILNLKKKELKYMLLLEHLCTFISVFTMLFFVTEKRNECDKALV